MRPTSRALRLFSCAALACCTFLALAAGDPVPGERLPGWAVPIAYELDLRVDPGAAGFSGRGAIAVQLERASDHLWLNGQDLDVGEVTVTDAGGRSSAARYVPVDPARGIARVDFGRTLAPQRIVVHLAWHAQYDDGDGAYRIEEDGRAYVATETEPLGARRMFPAFDEPGYKTPYTISLTVPEGMAAFANAPATGEVPAGDGWKIVSFAPTQPLPTYLVAFAVGPWDVLPAPALPARAGRDRSVPLRAIALSGRAADMRWVLAQTPGIVAALEDYYDSPYPWDKLDLLDVDGGMENPGLVALGSLGSAAPDAPSRATQGAFDLAAHELAHQWTGDLVTMAWWDDLWLSEALTIWMQQKLSLQLHPEDRADLERVRGAQHAMAADALASAKRVRQPVLARADIDSVFDGSSYGKGAAVLGMFEHYVGEDAFRRGLRDYVHAHASGSATASDLVDAVARASGDEAHLRAAFDSFLEQPGVPYVRVAVRRNAQGLALHLHQDRYRPIGSALAPLRWSVPVCVRYAGADSGSVTRSRCTLLDQADAILELPDAARDAWVMPNAGARGYYRFGMDRAGLATLAQHVGALDDAERLAYADAVDASFRRGDIDAGDVLAALRPLAALGGKDLAAAVLDQAGWLWRHGATTDAQRERLRAWIRATWLPKLQALGDRPRPGETGDDRALRVLLSETLALTYRIPEARAPLLARGDAALAAMEANADIADRDLLSAALGVLAQERGEPAVRAMSEALLRSRDPALRRAIGAGLAYADDPALAARVRDLALDPRIIGGERINLAIGRRDTRAQRDALWRWFEQHHATLLDHLPPAPIAVFPGMLGAEGCSEAEAERLQRFFGPRLAQRPGFARNLAQAEDAIRLCVALRQAQDGAAILR